MFADIFSSVDQGNNLLWLLPFLVLLTPSAPITVPAVKKLGLMMKSVSISDSSGWFRSIFLTLITLNLLGMTPFTFPVTSTIWLAAIMGLLFWSSILIAQVKIVPIIMAAHLSPSGAPFALSPLLVLIETISIIIRPLTLTVRLVANMTVGHIVCALMSVKLSAMSGVWSLSFVMMFYMIFEFGISLVQAYIFSLLLTLYSDLLLASMNINAPFCWKGYMQEVCELIPQTSPITLLFVFAIFCVLLLSPLKSKISLGGSFNAKVLSTFDVY